MTRRSVMYLCMRSASASSGTGVAIEGDWGLTSVPGMVGVASGSDTDVEVEVELFAVAVAVVESAASVGSSSQLAALQTGPYAIYQLLHYKGGTGTIVIHNSFQPLCSAGHTWLALFVVFTILFGSVCGAYQLIGQQAFSE